MFNFFKKKLKNFIIMGGPNSGKGSQCQLLVKKFDMVHVSTGDLLREAVANNTELGKQAKVFMKNGQLVPDELIADLLKECIKKNKNRAILLDGYPRNEEQAKTLSKIISVYAVVVLDVPDEILEKRATTRKTCDKCKTVYPPDAIAGKAHCDCGGNFMTREDDKPETVKARLKTYRKNETSVLGFYKQQAAEGKVHLIIIDGTPKIPEVDKALMTELEKLND